MKTFNAIKEAMAIYRERRGFFLSICIRLFKLIPGKEPPGYECILLCNSGCRMLPYSSNRNTEPAPHPGMAGWCGAKVHLRFPRGRGGLAPAGRWSIPACTRLDLFLALYRVKYPHYQSENTLDLATSWGCAAAGRCLPDAVDSDHTPIIERRHNRRGFCDPGRRWTLIGMMIIIPPMIHGARFLGRERVVTFYQFGLVLVVDTSVGLGLDGIVFAATTRTKPDAAGWYDEALATSPDGRWIAVGDHSGVVLLDTATIRDS
jgi:hypothetical protein